MKSYFIVLLLIAVTLVHAVQSYVSMKIIAFDEKYNNDVIHFVSSIQQHEFHVQITPEEQPDLRDIKGFFKNGNFLIALDQEKVIGTIGLVDIGNGNGALRKMFVHKDYRGKGVAQQLLEQLLLWAVQHNYTTVYLGTLPILYAAHRFYEKNGFVEIPEQDLPQEFPLNSVDKKFYKYKVLCI